MRLVRHRGKWAVRVNGQRYSTGFEATPENRTAAEGRGHEIHARESRRHRGEVCGDIVAAYFADMPFRTVPKTPSSGARDAARRVLESFSDLTDADITREHCRQYTAMRRDQGYSDGTIRKDLSTLRAALRWNDPQSPAVFEMPAMPPPEDRWLRPEEIEALRAAALSRPHAAIFIELAICTGGRKEAILGLTWQTHIDFDARRIWLGFKEGGKKRATVPMTETCRNALIATQTRSITPFVVEYNGKRVGNIRRALRAVYDDAGIEDVRYPAHVLRHTAGTIMANAGVPMFEISRRLGHSSIRVTEQTYAHTHPDYMSASTEALERVGPSVHPYRTP